MWDFEGALSISARYFTPFPSWKKPKKKMRCYALTQVQGEVDRIGVLDPVKHGLALPPCVLLVPVEVRQKAGVVAQLGI